MSAPTNPQDITSLCRMMDEFWRPHGFEVLRGDEAWFCCEPPEPDGKMLIHVKLKRLKPKTMTASG